MRDSWWQNSITVCAMLSCLMVANAQEYPRCKFRVVESYPHDESMFTQGLYWENDKLFESSGGYGKSLLRRYHWPTMKVEKEISIPDKVFAEGITVKDDKIYQLAWKSGEITIYDAKDLSFKEKVFFGEPAWGITHLEKAFIRSDGRQCLTYFKLDPYTKGREVCVRSGKLQMNAIAYQAGVIYANDFPNDTVVRINEKTAEVLDMLDLSSLKSGSNALVANGVAAYKDNQILVTGKQWDKLYVLDISKCQPASQ